MRGVKAGEEVGKGAAQPETRHTRHEVCNSASELLELPGTNAAQFTILTSLA